MVSYDTLYNIPCDSGVEPDTRLVAKAIAVDSRALDIDECCTPFIEYSLPLVGTLIHGWRGSTNWLQYELGFGESINYADLMEPLCSRSVTFESQISECLGTATNLRNMLAPATYLLPSQTVLAYFYSSKNVYINITSLKR